MKNKKVCIIGCIPEDFGGLDKGGIASHVGELYKNLIANNIKTVIFFNDRNNKCSSDIIAYRNRFNILYNSIIGFFKFGIIHDDNFSIKEKLKILSDANMIDILHKGGVNVFHVHSLHNLANKACEIANVRFVTTDHAFWHVEYNKNKIISNVNKSTLISISNISRNNMLSIGIKNKIVKINNPIDRINVDRKKTEKFKVYFNGISDAWNRKGLSVISKEMSKICEIENVHITIVTDIISKNKLISENPWVLNSNKVTILEPLSRKDNLELLGNSDVFLAPSLSEGFSIAYLESVMLSIPVIGFKDNIDEINNALGKDFCLSFEDSKDSICSLLLKIKNRSIIDIDASIYTWKYNINKYIDLYKTVCDEN